MQKSFIILVFSLVVYKVTLAQFEFANDRDTSWRIQSWSANVLKEKFNVDKDNDFELRLWIFENQKSNVFPTLFILSFKNQKWRARLFEDMSEKRIHEIPIEQTGLDSLWNNLNNYDLLTIPHFDKLFDLNEKVVDEMEYSQKMDRSYSFELLAKGKVRHYSYYCPNKWAAKYLDITTFRKVSSIVQLIISYCKLVYKIC
ncbi:MAG: hypothetical protein ABIN74_11190 [Ferruginibacter sp.]